MSEPTPTFRITPVDKGFSFEFDVKANGEERQRKRAVFGEFEMFCDESEQLGGDNSATPPLAYFASSIAF